MDPISTPQVARYRKYLTPDEFERVLALTDTAPPSAVRLNPLKVNPQDAITLLSKRYGWRTEQVPFCRSGWILHDSETPPGTTLEYRNGHYYIQDSSSMLPVEAFNFDESRSPLILDMAAAPGGKTTHLVARTGDAGLIVANDTSRRRIRALSGNLRTWGATSAVISNLAGEKLGVQLPAQFDKVLLDAPCSGESLRTSGGSKGRQVSDRERMALQSQQIRLLLAGIEALRPGGELVYATCTAAPEENEAVIQTALERKAGQIELTTIELADFQGIQPSGLADFEGQIFHPSMASTLRLWPHQFNTGAFFSARLIKTGEEEKLRSKSLGGTPPKLLDKQEIGHIHDQLAAFGFDLMTECQRSNLVLFTQDRFVHAASGLWLEKLSDLPLKGAGLPVGRWQGETFMPAHEWVTRYGSQFRERRYTLDAEHAQHWLRGADLRTWTPPVKGGVVLLQDESNRFLGVGYISANRVRNLLPRTWVVG